MSIEVDSVGERIQFLWTIENIRDPPTNWSSEFAFNWPGTGSKWLLTFTVHNAENRRFVATLKKLDACAPFELTGTFHYYRDRRYLFLKELESHEFLKGTSICVKFRNFVELSVILLIKLSDCHRKEIITDYFDIHSKCMIQTCNFNGIIRANWNESKNALPFKYVITVPWEFTDFFNRDTFLITLSLGFESIDTNRIEIIVEGKTTRPCFVKYSLNLTSEKEFTASASTEWMFYEKEDQFYRCQERWCLEELETNCLYQCGKYVKFHCEIFIVKDSPGVVERIQRCKEILVPHLKSVNSVDSSDGSENNCKDNLKDSVHTLYREGQLCDVTLRSENATFPCHKIVLCARSPVFKAMFENNMIEKESSIVDITDVDPHTLGLFIASLYEDELDVSEFKFVVKLYSVADKYAAYFLQKKCAAFIVSNLSLTNICEILQLADVYQDKYLEKGVEDFLNKHTKEVLNSSEWANFVSCNPLIAAKMMHSVFTALLH